MTRQVVARQPIGAIFTMAASFQTPEDDSPEVQTATMPDVATPDEVVTETWSPVFDRRFIPCDERGVTRAWLRMTTPMGDDPLLHACALAYESDDLPTDSVVSLHPDRPEHRDFEDYPFVAKLARWGIDVHQGTMFGLVNQIVLFLTASAIAAMVVMGYLMWWKRRPTRGFGAAPEPEAWAAAPWWGRVAVVAVGFVVALAGRGTLWWLPLFVVLVGGGLGLMRLLAPAAPSASSASEDRQETAQPGD